MNMLQIAGIGVVGTLLALQFKSGKAEYGIYTGIAVSLFLLFGMSGRLEVIKEAFDTIVSFVKVDNGYMKAILKMLGVTYVSEFASAICRDAGYQTIASQIEIFAKLTILALSMPVLEALLVTIQGFLG